MTKIEESVLDSAKESASLTDYIDFISQIRDYTKNDSRIGFFGAGILNFASASSLFSFQINCALGNGFA